MRSRSTGQRAEDAWADLLRGSQVAGMRAPTLAVGDGALGFWASLADVFPATRAQRRWVTRSPTSSTPCPSRPSPGPAHAAEIRDAKDRDHTLRAVDAFADEFGTRWPKAVAKIVVDNDVEPLLVFYEFPRGALDLPQDHQAPSSPTFATV